METNHFRVDRVSILVHEYDALGANILSRYSFMYQLIWSYLIGIIGLIAIIGTNSQGVALIVLHTRIDVQALAVATFALVTIGFVGLQLWIDHDVWLVARRLRQLEAQINELAGAPLLKWETKYGGGGWFWRLVRGRS